MRNAAKIADRNVAPSLGTTIYRYTLSPTGLMLHGSINGQLGAASIASFY